MDIVYDVPIMDKIETNFATNGSEKSVYIRKSVLACKVFPKTQNYNREINNIQKLISAMQIDSNNKRNKLSKSAKKRLRKKRQALAKLHIRRPKNLIGPKIQVSASPAKQTKETKSQTYSPITNQYANKIKSNEFAEEKLKKKCQDIIQSERDVTTASELKVYSFVVSGNAKKLPTEEIIWLLELQNYFVTNQWIVLRRKYINTDKSMITVGMDPSSERLLKNNNYQASLFRSTVIFTKKIKNVISNTRSSKATAVTSRKTTCKGNHVNKFDSSNQSEDKPFSWLGKWQTFTTSLNIMN